MMYKCKLLKVFNLLFLKFLRDDLLNFNQILNKTVRLRSLSNHKNLLNIIMIVLHFNTGLGAMLIQALIDAAASVIVFSKKYKSYNSNLFF
jgi:hypothetical protein